MRIYSRGNIRKPGVYYEEYEIEDICTKALTNVGLLPDTPSPVRIERFIEKHFNITPSYEQLPEAILGFTSLGATGVEAMTIADSLDETENETSPTARRLRTTLAHEAGHGLLHAHLFTQDSRYRFDENITTNSHMCHNIAGQDAGCNNYKGQWWEHQANLAMGALLLPEKLARTVINKVIGGGLLGHTDLSEVNTRATVNELSRVFNVNPIVAKIRMKQLMKLD
jgi:hypothetical protein